MRYFLHLAFSGINYFGWQRQPKLTSVQEILEEKISHVLKTPTSCYGCGRTDSQVNAIQYFAHIDIEEKWDYDLLFRINRLLPKDIAVYDIIPMEAMQHARYDAIQRTYDYYINTYKDPFLNDRSSFYPLKNMKLDKMSKAVDLLLKYDDFRAFCIRPDKHRSTVCKITSAHLYVDKDESRMRFQVSANRFLQGMIRILVSKLIEVGNEKISVDEFESYLITKITPEIIKPAHPQGLYLTKVVYPFLDIPARNFISSDLENTIWVRM